MKFLGQLLLANGVKLIGFCDSPKMELFEFIEEYKTIWMLPERFHSCYKSVHPNLRIKYIDLYEYNKIFDIIAKSKAKVFICNKFFPILAKSFGREHFLDYYPDFPESLLFGIELSTEINARKWQDPKNQLAAALLRMIRHAGGNGFHFLGDAQSLEDLDVTFRRTSGFKYVFKRMRLNPANIVHKALLYYYPNLAEKIRRLPVNRFYALVDDKVYYGENPPPTFHQPHFSRFNYFKPTRCIPMLERDQLEDEFVQDMYFLLNPRSEKPRLKNPTPGRVFQSLSEKFSGGEISFEIEK